MIPSSMIRCYTIYDTISPEGELLPGGKGWCRLPPFSAGPGQEFWWQETYQT